MIRDTDRDVSSIINDPARDAESLAQTINRFAWLLNHKPRRTWEQRRDQSARRRRIKHKMFDDLIQIRKMQGHPRIVEHFRVTRDLVEQRCALLVGAREQAVERVGREHDALMIDQRLRSALDRRGSLLGIHVGQSDSKIRHTHTIAS